MMTGMFSFFGYAVPLHERLELICRSGFEATSLWHGDDEPYVRDSRENEIPALARARNLFIENVHAPFRGINRLWSSNRTERAEIEARIEKSIRYCEKHSIPLVIMHVSNGRTPPEPNEAGLEIMVNLVELAESSGVSLLIENTRSIRHVDWLFERIASPSFGLCYDSSHDFLYSENPCELLRRFGGRLKAVHLSDNDGKLDLHWIPTRGVVDWERLIEAFPRSSYKGLAMLEIFPKIPIEEKVERFLEAAREKALWLKARLASENA
jgi:sugar phosphate isomerase/epimerase